MLAAANQHWEKLGIEAEHDKQLEQRLRPAKSTDEDVTVITKEDCMPLLDGGQGKDISVLLVQTGDETAQDCVAMTTEVEPKVAQHRPRIRRRV